MRLVQFSEKEGMEYALKELDDTKLDGKRIRLVEEKRSPSRSRSNRRNNMRSESNKSKSRSNDIGRQKQRKKSRDLQLLMIGIVVGQMTSRILILNLQKL